MSEIEPNPVAGMSSGRVSSVRTRKVFYIPGYDPIHARRYRELYRKESAAQAELSGYEISQRAKTGDGAFGWHVDATVEGARVSADVEVLVWSDIVRRSMSSSIPGTYWQLFRTAWVYITTGALRRLMWLRKGPVIAALYPVAMLLAQLIVSILAGVVMGTILTRTVDTITGMANWTMPEWVGPTLWWPVLLAVATLCLRWFKSKDNLIFAYYLMHDYAYGASTKGANDPDLEERMAEFGLLISAALRSDVDEVLVVGHSSGAHLGVSILADLLRADMRPAGGPALSFLTLGQVVPMISFLPKARRLRADLAYLSVSDDLTWIDISAPGDGCSFALCDPVAVSGVQPPGAKWPLVFSAAFTQTLKPETWAALRWRFFRLHFQYLCAFDNLRGQPFDYDYFRVTAGPLTLGDRYRDRASSRSRIDVPASKYTTVAEAPPVAEAA